MIRGYWIRIVMMMILMELDYDLDDNDYTDGN